MEWSSNVQISTIGIIGLSKDSDRIVDISFDILSLEALFLVPRVCSLLSLVPFFGTLVCPKPVMSHSGKAKLDLVDSLFERNGKLKDGGLRSSPSIRQTLTTTSDERLCQVLGNSRYPVLR